MNGEDGYVAIDLLQDARLHLWVFAIIFFGFGDTATTVIGLQSAYVVEVGPLIAPIIRKHGIPAIMVLKLATFGICYVIYRLVPSPHHVGVPLGLATLGVLVTGWNLIVLDVPY